MLDKTIISVLTEDQMIEKGNAQHVARIPQALRDIDILL